MCPVRMMKTNQFHWCVKTPPVSLSCVVNLHHDVLAAVNCACLTKVQHKETKKNQSKIKKIKYNFPITLWQYKSIQRKPGVLQWELGQSRQTASPAETAIIFLLDLDCVTVVTWPSGVQYHFTEAVVHNVKVRSVSWVGHLRQKRGREFMQGSPIQSAEKGMAPEVTEALPSQTVFPLRDEPSD